jgi:leader peptidase (prepilin peptidase)/N-methyltransferase
MTELDTIFSILFFILGLLLGSFYHVVALRVPEKKAIMAPDLLTIVGSLFRRGKCAGSCGKTAPYYPLPELTTGLLFALSFVVCKNDTLELFVSLALVSVCVIVSVSDILYQRIPNAVLLFFLPVLIALRLLSHPEPMTSYLIGGAAGFLILFLLATIKPGAMGMGDVKLFGLLGFVVGWQGVVVALFLSSLFALMIAVVLMLAGKVKWKGSIPFGPSLCTGAILAYFWEKNDPGSAFVVHLLAPGDCLFIQ